MGQGIREMYANPRDIYLVLDAGGNKIQKKINHCLF